jgi:aryl-alcohol dehydrogenase-like predicted oxidoreductase
VALLTEPKPLSRAAVPSYQGKDGPGGCTPIATPPMPMWAPWSICGTGSMIRRAFGSTGLAVSALGLGCNNFGIRLDLESTKAVVDAAIDAGINFIDTADTYGNRGGSETLLGAILGARRKDLILATKFGLPMDHEGRLQGGSRGYVMSAVEASLQRLKTDWIDIYYYHRPDPATPIEETLGALDDLMRQGKIRFAGCSNLPGSQLADAMELAHAKGLAPFAAAQDQYNLLSRGVETNLVPVVARYGIALVPYFPLASGLLTGKYRKGQPMPTGTRLSDARLSAQFVNEENFEMIERLAAFCAERGRTMLELAFGWLLARPYVASVIAGATTPEQLRQNVGALLWQPTADDISALDRITAT